MTMSISISEKQTDPIESIADMIKISNEWGERYSGHGFPLTWYRGQSQNWQLYPGIHREKYVNRAITMQNRLRSDGNPDWIECLFHQEYSMTVDFMRKAALFLLRT